MVQTISCIFRALTAALASAVLLFPAQSNAQVLGAVSTINRGKSILEFYEAAIANPQQLVLLSEHIRQTFANTPTRYDQLSNELAQNMGWFDKGPLGLSHIEVAPETSSGHKSGYFSITLKKLDFKQCEALANYRPINDMFVRVELNEVQVGGTSSPNPSTAVCKTAWFFQDGKNQLKYIGY